MKISTSLRRLYDAQFELNRLLEGRVVPLFAEAKRAEWFFRHRIKSPESFALKVETGRVDDPTRIDDFFACMLVVENRGSIGEAVEVVERFCEIRYRKPPVPGETHKGPESFPFDDLRLYVRLAPSDLLPSSELNEITFEVQIKTFLQHAWGIATHDLIYKGETVDWGRSRIAYQIKAMLEHAEVSIEQVEPIAQSPALAISDRHSRDLNAVITWLLSTWTREQLPADLVRLAETLLGVANAMNLGVGDLFSAVAEQSAAGEGANLLNLTPYGIVVRSLFRSRREAVLQFLRKNFVKGRTRLFVSEEMELGDLTQANPNRIVAA
jgi:hypothetical protein